MRLKISSTDELVPIIYYFNPMKRSGPIHTPSRNIMRGSQLFNRFLKIKYEDVDRYLSEISDDPEILDYFDQLYDRVRNRKNRLSIEHDNDLEHEHSVRFVFSHALRENLVFGLKGQAGVADLVEEDGSPPSELEGPTPV